MQPSISTIHEGQTNSAIKKAIEDVIADPVYLIDFHKDAILEQYGDNDNNPHALQELTTTILGKDAGLLWIESMQAYFVSMPQTHFGIDLPFYDTFKSFKNRYDKVTIKRIFSTLLYLG